MSRVQVWTVSEFKDKTREFAAGYSTPEELDGHTGESWVDAVFELGVRAHTRGDGVAVYVNNDLSHPDVGQWQVLSYGGDDAQLETREDWGQSTESIDYFTHGSDTLRTTLPDIGGRINWRYTLEAVVPSYYQHATHDANTLWEHLVDKHNHIVTGLTDADIPHWVERHRTKLHRATSHVPVPHEHPCHQEGCVYPQGHDLSVFPHRVEKAFNDPTVDCCGRDAADCDCPTYQIVRFYRDDRPRKVVKTGLTLEAAQAHCKDESTHGKNWFDGFEVES